MKLSAREMMGLQRSNTQKTGSFIEGNCPPVMDAYLQHEFLQTENRAGIVFNHCQCLIGCT